MMMMMMMMMMIIIIIIIIIIIFVLDISTYLNLVCKAVCSICDNYLFSLIDFLSWNSVYVEWSAYMYM